MVQRFRDKKPEANRGVQAGVRLIAEGRAEGDHHRRFQLPVAPALEKGQQGV